MYLWMLKEHNCITETPEHVSNSEHVSKLTAFRVPVPKIYPLPTFSQNLATRIKICTLRLWII